MFNIKILHKAQTVKFDKNNNFWHKWYKPSKINVYLSFVGFFRLLFFLICFSPPPPLPPFFVSRCLTWKNVLVVFTFLYIDQRCLSNFGINLWIVIGFFKWSFATKMNYCKIHKVFWIDKYCQKIAKILKLKITSYSTEIQ